MNQSKVKDAKIKKQIKIIKYSMSNKFQADGENLMVRRRISLQERTDQSQQDKKSLRMLQSIFQMNLNKFIRKNKDAFDASIQLPFNKPCMPKQEYQVNKKVLQGIDDYIQKLAKGMLLRNNYLQKQLKSFQEGYRESSVTPAFDNPEMNNSKIQNQSDNAMCVTLQNSWYGGYLSKADLSKGQTMHPRPISSTIQHPRTQERRRPPIRIPVRPLSSQLSRQEKQRPSINLKNVDIHKVKFQKGKQKIPLFRQSLCQVDFQRYEEQQVYIRKKITPQNTIGNGSNFLKAGSALYSRKGGDKPIITQKFRNFAQTKQQIEEREKQRLYNKVMMVNTVLAFNLHQTQGYKAKSKCWLNPII